MFVEFLSSRRPFTNISTEVMVQECVYACVCVLLSLCVCVCVCVCVFIKLHIITTQSGPVILVILCHSH